MNVSLDRWRDRKIEIVGWIDQGINGQIHEWIDKRS